MLINMHQFNWPISFACTLITDNAVLPNTYMINISIEPIENPQSVVPIGFKKIRHFTENYLHNSVFINSDHPLTESLVSLDTNLVIFPAEPYDYFVGGILCNKLRAISAKYFDIEFITIDSAIGDHIQYCIDDPEECGLDLKGDYWWNMDSVSTGIDNSTEWSDLNITDGPRFEPRIIKGGKSEN